ncbi:MAG: aspartate dehydrogenase [Fusicatenibacter sp.]|nr:aspartate dehydrogenase [Fusicatenibacter sp.]
MIFLFGHKKKKTEAYNPLLQKPMIRSSICTGEKVAGFKNLETGKFEEIMVIRDEKEYRSFLETYQIEREDVTTEY